MPILFLLWAVVFGVGCRKSASNANANKEGNDGPVTVTTEVATAEEIPTYVEATGSLTSDAESNVAPTVGGKIVSVRFDVGSYVSKGDPLVYLDSDDASLRLKQARDSVGQQESAVKTAETGVQQAIANLRQTQARLGVKDGESFDPNKFSQVISVRAQLELAEKELIRNERLLASGDISKSAYDRAKSTRDQLDGQLREAYSNANVAIKAISTAQKSVDSANAQVGNARAALATAQTQVQQAQKGVNDNVIYAPISGYISERNADPGEYISPSQPNAKIATIVRTAVLRLNIEIPEQAIDKVGVGQGISAQVSTYPERSFAGTIVRSYPNLNPQSRTLTVEAEIENVGGMLKPGQFATVRITQSKPEMAIMVPARAIKTNGETSVVYVVKDGIAVEHPVQLGLLENDRIEIKQGIAENDQVIVSDLSKITDGVIVKQ